jgi:DNA-binding transcriptional ArsR family regulator
MSNVGLRSDEPLDERAWPRQVLDYALDDVVHLDTTERVKAAGDPVRLRILNLVLERAMSVTELADRLRRPKGSVAHHVAVLHDAGLLQVVRTRRVRAVEERFYGRTARTIAYPGVVGELPFAADAAAEADHERMADDDCPSGFSYRVARIPTERAEEWVRRVEELALEFGEQARGGDTEFALLVGVFPTVHRLAPGSQAPTEERAP